MKKHDLYQDFFDHPERTPFRPDGIRGAYQPFAGCSDPIYEGKSLPLTDPEFDRKPSLPPEAFTRLLTFYCYFSSRSVRPGEICRALALEAEETLSRPAPPGELLFFVLLRYLDDVYSRRKAAIAAEGAHLK